MPTNEDLAWAAGIVDGEGCIYHAGPRPGRGTIGLQIGMGDAETLWRFYRIFGVGKIGPWTRQKSAHSKKPHRVFHATGADAIQVIESILPWLSSVKAADYVHARKLAPNAGNGAGGHNR